MISSELSPDEGGDGDDQGSEGDGLALQQGQHESCSGVNRQINNPAVDGSPDLTFYQKKDNVCHTLLKVIKMYVL